MSNFNEALEKAKAIAARLAASKRGHEGEDEAPPAKRPAYSDDSGAPRRAPLPDQNTLIYGGGSSSSDRGSSSRGLGYPKHATNPGDIEVVVMVKNEFIGSVIGRGGDKINELQRTSGAHVQIEQLSDMAPGATERAVTITGAPERVRIAEDLLHDTVREASGRRPGGANDDIAALISGVGGSGSVKEIVIPNDMAGLIIGRGGATIKELQDASGARIQLSQVSDMAPGSNERTVTLTGTAEAVERAAQLVEDKLQEGRGGPRGAAPGAATSLEMGVPDSMVGLIIGRGGSIIKDLQARSGSRIQISQPHELRPGTDDRIVTITGSPEACEAAKRMIEDQLADAHNQRRPPPPPLAYGQPPPPQGYGAPPPPGHYGGPPPPGGAGFFAQAGGYGYGAPPPPHGYYGQPPPPQGGAPWQHGQPPPPPPEGGAPWENRGAYGSAPPPPPPSGYAHDPNQAGQYGQPPPPPSEGEGQTRNGGGEGDAPAPPPPSYTYGAPPPSG